VGLGGAVTKIFKKGFSSRVGSCVIILDHPLR